MFVFSIQKAPSRLTKNLAISLFKESKSIVPKERITDIPLSRIPQNPLLSLLVAEEESFLLQEGSRHRLQTVPSFFRIRSSSASKILQHLAASRRLYFETTPLICDFFTRLHVRYLTNDTQQWAELYSSTLSWKAHECSLISHAGGGLVIAQSRLFFLDESVSVQEVLRFTNGPVAVLQAPKREEPVPLLQLNDHIGATALLYMRYGTVRYSFHDLFAAKNDRDRIAEKAWEKDLLECGYIKKDSGYYCPAPQIAAALEMLLGIGWNVLDIHGNAIMPLTQLDVESHLEQNAIQIKGKAFFNGEAADILFVLRSLKGQKLFLPLGNAKVGLLANHQALAPILPLLSDIECVGMTATVPKNRIGLLPASLERQGVPSLNRSDEMHSRSVFKGTLRPYQEVGVRWMHSLYAEGFCGILADDMGLGKTVQILAFLGSMLSSKKILIVVPTSLLFQWKQEIEKFLPEAPLCLYYGTERKREMMQSITLTSYSIVRQEQAFLSQLFFDCIIVDEAQTIKNHETHSFRALQSIPSAFRLSVTGTPIENSLLELWTQFAFLDPTLLGTKEPFTQSLPKEELQRIRKKIAPFFLRRTKQEVAPDLPEKIEQTVFVAMTEERSFYDSFIAAHKDGLLKKIAQEGMASCRMQVFEMILRLKQICCHPLLVSSIAEAMGCSPLHSAKYALVLEDIATVLAEGKKVVLFSQFATMLSLLAKEAQGRGWNFVLLDGQTANRDAVVHTFQNDESVPLLFASLKAGGVGLNLTRADCVFLYDPWWNRAQERQAIDRAHRIGRQTPVFCKRYIVKNSIEEKILALQEQKQLLADQLLHEDGEGLPVEELTFLLGPILHFCA